MNLELNFYRKIFQEFLPLWSERVGYIQGFQGFDIIYPEKISKIPIQFAPASSLDGLFIDLGNSPSSPQLLSNYIQTLAPGGIVIAHLKKEFWNEKTILNTFKTSGFEIIYISKIPNFKIKKINKNFLKPKGILYRLFLNVFPLSIKSFKNHWFIIARKYLIKNKHSDHIQFSLVIPIENQKEIKKAILWEEFFQTRKIYNVEIVLVNNTNYNIELIKTGAVQFQIIQHYYQTSLDSCVYSGIYNSRGKITLVDITKEESNPEVFFELLDNYLKKIDLSRPFAVYAYPHILQKKYFRRFLNLIFYGIDFPESNYRMYNLKALELFFRFHPYILEQKPNLIEKEILKNKGKIIQIPYYEKEILLKKKF